MTNLLTSRAIHAALPDRGRQRGGRVHRAAGTGLFQPGEVKVRLSLYQHHCVGGEAGPFVHLIFYLLAGRSDDDKRALSRRIVRALVQRLPQVPAISLDVRDIRREVFGNRRNCQED